MKLARLGVAILGGWAAVASAQSSLTLFGTIDVAGRYVKSDGQPRRIILSTDGLNSSQLGLRGVEDLGGGLRAGFTLLSGVNANNGTSSAESPPQRKFWNRRSTLSLFGNFGEIRLGRDYLPTFWNFGLNEAFGLVGLGAATNVRQIYGGSRADNAIGYFLPPNLGGLYGQVMVASGWGTSAGGSGLTQSFDLGPRGRHIGGRLGYVFGRLDVVVGYAEQDYAVATPLLFSGVIANAGTTQKTANIGANYDFGVFKLFGYYDREKLEDKTEETYGISGIIPFGVSEIHVGYDNSHLENGSADTKVDQVKVQYIFNLSKRTALYAAASQLNNRDSARIGLPGQSGPVTVNGKSKGAEFGIRHFF